MKKELFNELLESVKEAAAIERGTRTSSRKFKINCGKVFDSESHKPTLIHLYPLKLNPTRSNPIKPQILKGG
jgi:hypothetical protein